MAGGESGLYVKLDEKAVAPLVDAQIHAAIAEVLGRDPQRLVETVVSAALHAKANSYDRETLFEKAVTDMIRQEASRAFNDWLVEHRPMVRTAVLKRLTDESGFADMVADALIKGLAGSFYVSVSLKALEEV